MVDSWKDVGAERVRFEFRDLPDCCRRSRQKGFLAVVDRGSIYCKAHYSVNFVLAQMGSMINYGRLSFPPRVSFVSETTDRRGDAGTAPKPKQKSTKANASNHSISIYSLRRLDVM